MSAEQATVASLASGVAAKMTVLKIVGAVVLVSVVSAGGYYAYKKVKQSSVSEAPVDKTVCPPGQTYNSSCGYCTPICGKNAVYNCLRNKCECKPGLVGDPYGQCVCPNNTEPSSAGVCSAGGQFACPEGQFTCPWDPQGCYRSETVSNAAAVDPNTGFFRPNSRIQVPCGERNVVVTVGSPQYNKAIAANPGILDEICRSVTCVCSDPSTCSFPECGPNSQRFIGYSKSEGKCVIRRDCSTVPSSYRDLVTGSINRNCLVKKDDPTNPADCSDLSYEQLKNICEYDSNGCRFGFTFDSASGLCKNSSGATAAKGPIGCRAVSDNTQMIGYNCALFNTKYYIRPNITLATSSQIQGSFYLNRSEPVSNVTLWKYAIFKVDDRDEIVGSVFSTGYFIPTRDPNGTITVTDPATATNSNYPNFLFNIYISGIGINPYLTAGRYRILFSGYQENNGIFNTIYASVNNGANNYKLTGDLFPVSTLDAPRGNALTMMVNPTAAQSSTVITNMAATNILANVFSNAVSANPDAAAISSTAKPPAQGLQMIPLSGLNYGLITCSSEQCGAVLDQMTAIIAWNTPNITIPSGKYLKYYVTRINPAPLTTENIINVVTSGNISYIGDLQTVNNTFIYQIRTVLADTATERITEASYQTYYARGDASAPRIVTVYYPQYTNAVCNTIPAANPPGFYILYNPTGEQGRGGYCAPAQISSGLNVSYYDWYCNAKYGRSSAPDRTSFSQIGANDDIYLWNAEAGQCSKVEPNKKPTLINYNDVSTNLNKAPSQVTQSQWINGVEIPLQAACGAVGNPAGGAGGVKLPEGNTNSWHTYGTKEIKSNKQRPTDPPDDLDSRLRAADTFGVQYVHGWQGSPSSVYDTMVSNLYSCPLDSKADYYKSVSNCAPGDTVCQEIATKLKCGTDSASNSCENLVTKPNAGYKHAYGSNNKWLPDISTTTSTEIGRLACNSQGTYNRFSGTGSCRCNVGFAGSNCQGLSNLRNSTGCILSADGTCGPNSTVALNQCLLYVDKNDTVNNPRGLEVPLEYQKLLPGGNPGEGCVFNYNPIAWADVTGFAAHSSDRGDYWNCSNLSNSGWRSIHETGDNLGIWTNACGLETRELRRAISQGRWTSPTSGITYDFSNLVLPTGGLPAPIIGPYAGVQYEAGNNPNNSSIQNAIPWDKPNRNKTYSTFVNQKQVEAIQGTGNSPGRIYSSWLGADAPDYVRPQGSVEKVWYHLNRPQGPI